jgi:hypothetical protein
VKAGNTGGPLTFGESDYPCNDVMVFRWWAFSSGSFHHGPRKGHPIPMRHASPGKLAFLTSRRMDMPEAERRVIGCFRISEIEETDGEFWALSDSASERIRVTEMSRAPRFWDFYRQSGGPRWNTGLFRYLPDNKTTKLYAAVVRAAKR